MPASRPSSLAAAVHRARAGLVAIAIAVAVPFAAAAAAAAQPIEVGGRVLSDGRPLPGAAVELVPLEDELSEALRRLAGDPAPVAARAQAGDDGRFAITSAEDGMFTLVVSHPGRVSLRAWLAPLVEPRDLRDAPLERDVGLTVEVVDAEGRPVPGAEAEVVAGVLDPHRQSTLDWHPAPRRGTGDQRGRLRLPRRVDERLDLAAWAAGRREARLRVEADDAGPVRITLPTAVERRLNVRAGEEPAAGVVVRVGEAGWPAAVTGEDGTATLPVAADGTIRVQLDAGDGWRTEPFDLDAVELGDEAQSDLPPAVLPLPPPRSVAGEVVAAGSGDPIADALVWARGNARGFVRSDGSGRFRIVHGAREEVEIAAAAPGYLVGEQRGSGPAARERLRLVLEPNAAIAGTVHDADGRPLERVEIWLRAVGDGDHWSPWTADGPHSLQPRARTWTDARGRFRLPGFRAGDRMELRAAAPGFAPATAFADAGGQPLRLVLEIGRQVHGRVVGVNGEAVAGARVGLAWVPSSRPWSQHFVAGRQLFDYETTSDPEGRFAVVDLPPGEYDGVIDGRPTWALRKLLAIRVSADEGADLGEVRLERAVTLDLAVVDEEGEAVPGAEVSFTVSSDGSRASGVASYGGGQRPTSDREGRVRLTGLAPGEPVDFSVRHAQYRPVGLSAVVPPLEEALEVVLERGLTIFGRVVSSDGRPASRASVALLQEWVIAHSGGSHSQSSHQGGSADAEGVFEYRGLERSPRLELSATWQGERGKLVLSDVPERGSVGPLEIRLQPASRLRGVVLQASGEPAVGVEVTMRPVGGAMPARGPDERRATTDATGRFDFVADEAGPVEVSAVREELIATARVTLAPGDNELELVLEEPRRPWIAGRVVDPEGRPVPRALVEATCVEGCEGSFGQSADSAGGFVIRGLERAVYRLDATHAGFAAARGEVDLRGGARDDVELALRRGGAVEGTVAGVAAEDFPLVTVVASSPEAGRPVRGVVDHRGGYRIGGLSPGIWRVSARAETLGLTAEGDAEVLDDDHTVRLDLELDVQGVRLSGRLTVDGQPAANARLSLSRETPEGDAAVASGASAFDGSFRFAGVEPGTYRLRVHGGVGVPPTSRVVDLLDDHEIALDLTVASVEGRLLLPSGTPVEGLRVVLVDPAGGELYATVSSVGRFQFPVVGGGGYLLSVRRGEAVLATQPLEVGPQDLAGLIVVLE